MQKKFALIATTLSLLFLQVYAYAAINPKDLEHLVEMSSAEIKAAEPVEENESWRSKLSPYVRLDKNSNTFYYNNGHTEKNITNQPENGPNHQQITYLGELKNKFYLFRHETWSSWKVAAVSVEQKKQIAFNMAETFVSNDKRSLLILNIPPESCQKDNQNNCLFSLTQYNIENKKNLQPFWQGKVYLPRDDFVFIPFWDTKQNLWLQITGAREELYYLKAQLE